MSNRSRVSGMVLTTVILAMAPLGAAIQYSEKYQFSTKEPLEVPEATLPPGQYVLSIHDKLLDREIFQVRDAKGKVFSSFLAIPSSDHGDANHMLTFWPPDGPAKPVRSWFTASDGRSWEFVYPKERAVALAKSSGSAIPAVDLSAVQHPTNVLLSPDDLHALQLWLVTPKRVEGVREMQIAAAKISPRRAPVQVARLSEDETRRMPHTASHFFEDIALGLFLIAGGVLVSRLRFPMARR